MRIARVTIDLMRPVPLAPLTFETEVLREGRKIQLCAVRLKADGVVVVAATVLKVRRQPLPLPADLTEETVTLPGPDAVAARSRPNFSNSPFVTGMSLRSARGRFGVPGPGAIWYRVDRPLVEGFDGLAGDARGCRRRFLQRHLGRARFPALDLPQCRPHRQHGPRSRLASGSCSTAESWIGPDGAGLAMMRLADQRGYFGRAVQSLVIEKR